VRLSLGAPDELSAGLPISDGPCWQSGEGHDQPLLAKAVGALKKPCAALGNRTPFAF